MKYDELKDCDLVKHLIKDIDDNADWLCFFLMFSRFEYALKRSKYAKMNNNNLEIEWDRFGKEVKETFATYNSDELSKAIDKLKNKPPKKQVLKDGQLGWDCPNEDYRDIQTLINAIKRVRNNLFHGGKFPNPTGPVEDPTRNKELIKHSIIVLKHLLYSSPEVQRHYFEELEWESKP